MSKYFTGTSTTNVLYNQYEIYQYSTMLIQMLSHAAELPSCLTCCIIHKQMHCPLNPPELHVATGN